MNKNIPKDCRYSDMQKEDRKVFWATLAIIAVCIIIGINITSSHTNKMSYEDYKTCSQRYQSC